MIKHVDKRKTFIRHLTYDVVFLIENIGLAVIGYHLTIEPVEELDAKNTTIIVSCTFHLVGLLMKLFYYKKLHVWSDLISVIHKDTDKNWVFETNFVFLGNNTNIRSQIFQARRQTVSPEN